MVVMAERLGAYPRRRHIMPISLDQAKAYGPHGDLEGYLSVCDVLCIPADKTHLQQLPECPRCYHPVPHLPHPPAIVQHVKDL